ncbi:hypothetical protein T4C_3238 [Trichinella pseudospiralis]|uniref:Uncharacterized protein n=1 Tax=Trichinella pseudospiralis TaxID=6337 RepID=A0A0V1FU40_TRIPS|nr:hypothetical protein T4D_306 [Trichinella pseudospiralis]KRZ43549.1 hypothetical protein T4C_3238 [Trichinella pseudospiralis]
MFSSIASVFHVGNRSMMNVHSYSQLHQMDEGVSEIKSRFMDLQNYKNMQVTKNLQADVTLAYLIYIVFAEYVFSTVDRSVN